MPLSVSASAVRNRLDATFERLRAAGECGVFPYLTVGYPDGQQNEILLRAAIAGGADGLELGIPFSDPLADGATLQHAGYVALRGGASVAGALALAGRLRARADLPLVFMSYCNPILAHGLDRFCARAADQGADGVIVPDLPLEEAGELAATCRAHGLHFIYMLAPTSSDERIASVARVASGFIYCVSLVGVTGARRHLASGLSEFLARVRRATSLPLLVGFGISEPEHVREVARYADAVVVASALTNLVDRTPEAERARAVEEYMRSLKAASRP